MSHARFAARDAPAGVRFFAAIALPGHAPCHPMAPHRSFASLTLCAFRLGEPTETCRISDALCRMPACCEVFPTSPRVKQLPRASPRSPPSQLVCQSCRSAMPVTAFTHLQPRAPLIGSIPVQDRRMLPLNQRKSSSSDSCVTPFCSTQPPARHGDGSPRQATRRPLPPLPVTARDHEDASYQSLQPTFLS